jgi:hypothetical protein
VLAVVVVGAGGAGWVLTHRAKPIPEGCALTDGAARYRRPLDQTELAADVAAVGVRLGLPDHAITIALATAMQESGLRDLPGGDRDSIGAFQQRPSQGWGTPSQLLDVGYAAQAFYDHLRKVPGWQRLSVAEAAQAVQRSAAPAAYAKWEPEARGLAKAFTGEAPGALACAWHRPHTTVVAADLVPRATAALGEPTLGTPVSSKRGWIVASWLVAHAPALGLGWVDVDGQRCDVTRRSCTPFAAAAGPTVRFGPTS